MNPENMDTKLPQLKPADWKSKVRTDFSQPGLFQVQGKERLHRPPLKDARILAEKANHAAERAAAPFLRRPESEEL